MRFLVRPRKSRWSGADRMEWCPSKLPDGNDAAHSWKIYLSVVSYKPRDLRRPSMCSAIAREAGNEVERGVCPRSLWSRCPGTKVTLLRAASRKSVGAPASTTLTQMPLLAYLTILVGASVNWSVVSRAQVSVSDTNTAVFGTTASALAAVAIPWLQRSCPHRRRAPPTLPSAKPHRGPHQPGRRQPPSRLHVCLCGHTPPPAIRAISYCRRPVPGATHLSPPTPAVGDSRPSPQAVIPSLLPGSAPCHQAWPP